MHTQRHTHTHTHTHMVAHAHTFMTNYFEVELVGEGGITAIE